MTRADWIRPEWIALGGLAVAAHRLAVGFYLADGPAAGAVESGMRVAVGVLAAAVLTGTQMYLAGVIARVDDALLRVGWLGLLVASTAVMAAATLASLYSVPLVVVLEPAWLGRHVPAAGFALVLSAVVELSLGLVRRAAALDEQRAIEDDPTGLSLDDWQADELAVQAALSDASRASVAPVAPSASRDPVEGDEDDESPACQWCDWRPDPGKDRAQAIRGHRGRCPSRPR